MFLDFVKQGKIVGFGTPEKILLEHLLRGKITDYGKVKLIDEAILKNQDVLDKYEIDYESLSSKNDEVNKERPVYDKINITIAGDNNVIEIRLPWLPKDKFDILIGFFKKELDLQFEFRRGEEGVWFSLIRDINIFDELLNHPLVKLLGYDIDEEKVKKAKDKIKIEIEKQKKLFELSVTAQMEETEEFKGMFEKLYPFQKVSVEYSKLKRSILIADEMGLGKTIQALAIIEFHQLYPALIVVPAMLKKNWAREINAWLPHKSVVVVDKNKIIPPGDLYIVSYSMASKVSNRFVVRKPKVIVCDESHYLKNPKAARTDFILKNFKNVPFKMLTTGTPILNRTVELVPQLDLLGILDSHFGGKRKFINRYAPPQWNGFGTTYGSANEEELQVELRKSCMIRRMKKDVLTELPDKIRQVVYLPLSDKAAYEKVEDDSINWYETKLRKQDDLSEHEILEAVDEKLQNRSEYAEKMVRVEYLRQAALEYKLDAVYEWVDDALEQTNKLILFTYHRDAAEKLYDRYGDQSVLLYGGMSDHVEDIVNKFINDRKIHLFIGSVQSSGVGIDGLQDVCDKVAFVELPWTPAVIYQAEDRAHRIGQKNAVNIYYLIGEDTIEEHVYGVVIGKEEIFDKATNINKLFTWMKKRRQTK
jgi:SWI/SNF-related matrix-associated actin-dependent regulator 1 of chromatin subfamily A